VQDWVVRPLLRSIPGVAEINSQGGYARQYQVLVNPTGCGTTCDGGEV
jgi:cobalt-zinc-cadmium resistance protein CzcA